MTDPSLALDALAAVNTLKRIADESSRHERGVIDADTLAVRLFYELQRYNETMKKLRPDASAPAYILDADE